MWLIITCFMLLGHFLFGPIGAILFGITAIIFIKQSTSNLFHFNHIHHEQQIRAQTAFFRATFIVMGRLAKADGRINEQEIKQATLLMNHMRLTEGQRLQAIEYFNQGKSGQVDIGDLLFNFKQSVTSKNIFHAFMEIQLQAAYADGDLKSAEREVLMEVCDHLNINRITFEILVRRVQAQKSFYQQQSHYNANSNSLDEAYRLLNCSPKDDWVNIKKAYRKLISEHHPDKLVSKGLPKEMMEMTKKKTQEIQAAYDLIRKSRGMK